MGKSKMGTADLKKGIQKIRRTFARKDAKKAEKELKASKDSDVMGVLEQFDGSPSELLSSIKTIIGPTTDEAVQALFDGHKKKPAKESKSKTPKQKDDDAVASPKDDSAIASAVNLSEEEYEMETVDPLDMTCPDKNKKGDPVFIVTTKEKFYTCASVKNPPEQASKTE